jgi:hypothetical protein
MRYYRYVEEDIPDMMAHGFMSLREKLVEQPDFLTTVDHGGAIKWVNPCRLAPVAPQPIRLVIHTLTAFRDGLQRCRHDHLKSCSGCNGGVDWLL